MSQPRTKKGVKKRHSKRRTLLAELGTACHYCGKQMPDGTETLDHIVPYDKSRSTANANLVLACYPCNNSRGNKPHVCSCPRCLRAWELHETGMFGKHAPTSGRGTFYTTESPA